jgi:hypothetical protein
MRCIVSFLENVLEGQYPERNFWDFFQLRKKPENSKQSITSAKEKRQND